MAVPSAKGYDKGTKSPMHRHALLLSLLLALTGCPRSGASSQGGSPSLVLKVDGSADAQGGHVAGVGSSTALRLSLPQGTEGAQLFGALLSAEPARVTRWHADPESAVEFQGNKAVFRCAGPVKVWATWQDSGGHELASNQVAFTVQ